MIALSLSRSKAAEAVAIAVLLAAIVLRGVVSSELFPLWSEDPAAVPAAVTALTPSGSLAIDVVMLVASGTVFFFAGRNGRSTPVWMVAAASLGACGVLLHAFVLHSTPSPFQLEHLLLGSSWCAAIFAALAIRTSAHDQRLRGIILAALVGLVGPLAAKGVVQVFIEHPQTLAAFNANKVEMLGIRGWSEDSPMARAFVRRLSQPEGTGWTGLANVYSSIAAFATVAIVGVTLVLARSSAKLLAAASLLIAATALALSKSKGGISSAILIGLPILGTLLWIPKTNATARIRRLFPRLRPAVGVLCIFVPLLGVVVRGLVGTRMGELSLLFRWFYMQGAARIFVQHLPFGVGPDGFQAAYLLAKPAISPEAVASPHSVLLDWLSTLGLFGAAWCGLLIALALAIGRHLSQLLKIAEDGDVSGKEEVPGVLKVQHDGLASIRIDLRILFLIFAIPTVLGSWIETPGTTVEGMLARFVGLVLACIIAAVVLLAHDRDVRRTLLGVAAGALAVLAHAQIELTGITPGSCAWFLAILAAASAPSLGASYVARTLANTAPTKVPSSLAASLACVACAIAVARGFVPVLRWESQLRLAAHEVEVLADTSVLMREASHDPGNALDLRREAVSKLLDVLPSGDRTEPRSAAEYDAIFDRVLLQRLPRAEEHLAEASRTLPSHFATHQALSRLRMHYADGLQRAGRSKEAANEAALAVGGIRDQARADPTRAAVWSWLALIEKTGRTLTGEDEQRQRECEAWERAASLDPFAVTYPVELARAYRALGDVVKARQWARRALENNANMRLDPLQGLSDALRIEMEALAK